jgi:oligopeptide transport system permease protein
MAIFGFSIITETQWNIPGLGKMLTTCLTPASNEPMVIMMYITISSVLITFTSLLADLIMIWLDPRVKIQGGKK